MPTVAEVMDEAARECSTTPPSSWITATTLSYMELKDFLKQTAKELLDRIDWPDPIAQDYAVPGTGVPAYALPAAFKRLTRDPMAVYETTGNRRACTPVTTNGVWTYLVEHNAAGGTRYFRTSGDEDSGYEIEFFADLETGNEVTVSYISKNWLKSGGSPAAIWADVADTLLLPEDLIRMGVIWRFRRRKGLPYADRMAEYEAILARHANDSRIIRSVDMTGGSRKRNPFDIPVPDYIPSS
jgi:hypothetical protein